MIDALVEMSPAALRQLGVMILIAGITLITSSSLKQQLNIAPRAGALIAAVIGFGALYTWRTSPQFAETMALLSTAFALLLPVAICLHVFRELLVVT